MQKQVCCVLFTQLHVLLLPREGSKITMACPVLHPLNEIERQQLCEILHFSSDARVWQYVCQVFQPYFDFNQDTDLFREKILSHGQSMFHFMLLKLCSRFDNSLFSYKHRSKMMMYRYVWLEIDSCAPHRVHVMNKGSLWYTKLSTALHAGRKYRPNYDLPSSFQPPQVILTVESMCRCQMVTCPLTEDIFTTENCECDGHSYISQRKFPIAKGESYFHGQICITSDNKKVLVIRLANNIVDASNNTLYCFCIPRSDCYFMSRSKRISLAFKEFLRNN